MRRSRTLVYALLCSLAATPACFDPTSFMTKAAEGMLKPLKRDAPELTRKVAVEGGAGIKESLLNQETTDWLAKTTASVLSEVMNKKSVEFVADVTQEVGKRVVDQTKDLWADVVDTRAPKTIARIRNELLGEQTRTLVGRFRDDLLGEDTQKLVGGFRDQLLGEETKKLAGSLRDEMLGRPTREHVALLRDELLGPRTAALLKQLLADSLLNDETAARLAALVDKVFVPVEERLESINEMVKEDLGVVQKNAVWIILLLALVALSIIGWVWYQRRKYLRMLRVVTMQIKEAGDQASPGELTEAIKARALEEGVERHLNKFLQRERIIRPDAEVIKDLQNQVERLSQQRAGGSGAREETA